jgi:hypothetical protein
MSGLGAPVSASATIAVMKFSTQTNGVPPVSGGSWIRVDGLEVAGQRLATVFIRLGLSQRQQLIATGLLVETDGELSTRALRIPLTRIVREYAAATEDDPQMVRQLAAEIYGHPELMNDPRFRDYIHEPNGVPPGAVVIDTDALRKRVRRPPPSRPGRRGHPESFYRKVADDYSQAKRDSPREPVREMFLHMGYWVTDRQIRRYIKKAREMGFIKADDMEG